MQDRIRAHKKRVATGVLIGLWSLTRWRGRMEHFCLEESYNGKLINVSRCSGLDSSQAVDISNPLWYGLQIGSIWWRRGHNRFDTGTWRVDGLWGAGLSACRSGNVQFTLLPVKPFLVVIPETHRSCSAVQHSCILSLRLLVVRRFVTSEAVGHGAGDRQTATLQTTYYDGVVWPRPVVVTMAESRSLNP